MKTHELKIWPPFFEPLLDGRKRFEVRFNDRGFWVGDHILFREWEPESKAYTGHNLLMRVRYILAGGPLYDQNELKQTGLESGYVVLDLDPVPEVQRYDWEQVLEQSDNKREDAAESKRKGMEPLDNLVVVNRSSRAMKKKYPGEGK